VVAPGAHAVELIAAQASKIARTVTTKQKDLDVKFDLGFVETGAGKAVQVAPGVAARRAVFEAGPHRLTITGGDDGPHQVTVVVHAGATTTIN
jgi:hypothetical protein